MGPRGRILAVTLLSCAILPLLASALLPVQLTYDIHGSDPNPDESNYVNTIINEHDLVDIPQSDGFFTSIEKEQVKSKNGRLRNKKERGSHKKKHKREKKHKKEKKHIKEHEPILEPETEIVEAKPVIVPEEPVKELVKPVVNEPAEPVQGGLRVGYYQKTCPQAENIVKEAMEDILNKNVKIGPSIVRLFFHDCFVTGCDASLLLDKTPSGEPVEKEAVQNGLNVKGYAEIQEIKTRLEAACPGIVSCADVLAFANREALNHTGVPRFDVVSGRRDRPVSLAKNVEANVPLPETPIQQIIQVFAKKGMNLEDLVLLIGAHSIGEAQCRNVADRFGNEEKRKEINPRYLDKLHVHIQCVDPNQTLPFDRLSHHHMDAAFYKQLLASETLLESDHNLMKEPNANALMKKYADDQDGWLAKFTQSIIKLGNIEVLTGDQGEIRKQCNAFN
ncbi:hypothetical protein RD792_018138 [Penstemon davidsonii]|uniref:peroxidase n=1 Tax=Penstemon davidsonii TaxID=160366 RepID=A0ABR0DWQ9_9LAMI|nr:hypothetical protein RD792_018138 [Penstemon davidsonii]